MATATIIFVVSGIVLLVMGIIILRGGKSAYVYTNTTARGNRQQSDRDFR